SWALPPTDCYVHLIGVPHPAPWKKDQFYKIDLRSLEASVEVAVQHHLRHFVFVSVARPAPVMRGYQEVRARCEAVIERAGLNATILRPWCILGSGHRWPVILEPVYRLAEHFPLTRDAALGLGLLRY